MSHPPEQALTFMFTDVEGSTQLWARSPETMRAALEAHDRLLRQAIRDCGGTVFATAGDGFSAVFPTPAEAARAAIAIQRGLAESPELRVRIGLHSGIAYQREGDYFGPEVNRAARVSAAGNGGGLATPH